ncbi:site-specific integrase [uncultured Nevskia sp.]|uniref:tyrosine-type recombinase/integrase n=1 Tax=uncultured Nevskia sp. TaxID=228950 RepID=UPI0025E2F807|nr:site-specific integrase [uncultured Nevskia sp.]
MRHTHGRERENTTFETRLLAEQWLAGVKSGEDKGRLTKTIDARNLSLADALNRRLAMCGDQKSNAEQTRQTQRLIENFPGLTGKRLYEIDEIDVLGFIEEREEEVANGTINRELSLISNTFNRARSRMHCVGLVNPIGPTTRLKEAKGRDHRLAADEEELLLRLADPVEALTHTPIGSIIRFAVGTAMRKSEIARMDWRHVNLDRGTALIPDSKNGSPRTVPLGLAMRSLVREQGPKSSGCVWAGATAISSAWQRLKRTAIAEAQQLVSAGIALSDLPERLLDLRFHDLRHEATSRLIERTGWDNARIRAVTGHKTDAMLARYTHLRTASLALELAALEGGAVLNLHAAGAKEHADHQPEDPSMRAQWKAVAASTTLLTLLISAKPIAEVAKEFGVSDAAVHKACKRLGVEKQRRGFWLEGRQTKVA